MINVNSRMLQDTMFRKIDKLGRLTKALEIEHLVTRDGRRGVISVFLEVVRDAGAVPLRVRNRRQRHRVVARAVSCARRGVAETVVPVPRSPQECGEVVSQEGLEGRYAGCEYCYVEFDGGPVEGVDYFPWRISDRIHVGTWERCVL